MGHNHQVDPTTAPPAPAFPRTKIGSRGYSRKEVDRFVSLVDRALDRDPPGLAPEQVEQWRFHGTRWRHGYAMEPVDTYLDEVGGVVRSRGGHQAEDLQGPRPAHHVRTWWIYALALVLSIVIAVFAFTVT